MSDIIWRGDFNKGSAHVFRDGTPLCGSEEANPDAPLLNEQQEGANYFKCVRCGMHVAAADFPSPDALQVDTPARRVRLANGVARGVAYLSARLHDRWFRGEAPPYAVPLATLDRETPDHDLNAILPGIREAIEAKGWSTSLSDASGGSLFIEVEVAK